MQYAAAGIGMVVVVCVCFFRCCGRARKVKGRDKKDAAPSKEKQPRQHTKKVQRNVETRKASKKKMVPPAPSIYDEDQRHLLSSSPSPRRKSRSPSPRKTMSTTRREQQRRDLYSIPADEDNDIFMFPLMDDNQMRQQSSRRPPRRTDLQTINYL